MPQLRKDPLSDYWVIIAEGREQRPDEYERTPRRRIASECPFCAGNEQETPLPVAVYSADRGGPAVAAQRPRLVTPGTASRASAAPSLEAERWLVRVVPNKYPALLAEGHAGPYREGPYEVCDAVGAHEVIIESPRHVASLSELTDEECRTLLIAYRDRMVALLEDPRFRYALIFKNVGPEGGASLEHSHSQIVATPMVPIVVQRELTAARRWHDEHGQCYYCEMLEYEQRQAVRLVGNSDLFQALCPFASRMPFETWILPRKHASHFEAQSDEQLAELARFLQELIKKLERTHPHVAYNYFIHTAPFDTRVPGQYHWHIEVFPRLTTTAGFEWGAGYFINPVPPEEAAAILRT